MPRIDLKGLPICITGASSGIGKATALECARAGMPTMLGARRTQMLEEVAGRIRDEGGTAQVECVDVTDAQAAERLIGKCVEEFGGIYAVFANAGYGEESPVHSMDEARLRAMFETNFFGTLNVVCPAVKHMRSAGRGHVLICSSSVARFPLPYFSIYSATKAAQHHISRAMNLELAPEGIHVSSVHPVGTRTEFFEIARSRSGTDDYELVDHTSDRFKQTPERVARAIVRCLHRPRPEVWTSAGVRYGMVVAGAIPTIADRFVRRMVHQRRSLDAGAGHPDEEP